ncbi:ATP:cob(I)alamin adenosyltransferase [Prevotella intermedia]|uniref:cob(I)yrinic acid a,c-diamide adenosyltransferase n=1 Tax=Prevotella intermedia TaxID=28131 RepID=UPI000C1BFB55|nr:cob(I)yrinic acid a,c-diamide adenosyltransferase [Prevotella intermedia]ATV33274.1 ATP:cob(I)alamin adenosyltransferase [Prevotella intermedia]ATV40321.1 ATP:cob(I)alamin adenosyltransferase [Prevotella intermedia]
MSKVYTKTGDKGTTSLIGGTRVKKSDIRIESYGTVDELNSFIGLLATYVDEKETADLLAEIQNVLFNVGCNLAMGESFKKEIKESVVADALIEHVEKAIDRMQAAIPELKSFVIPGGSRSASTAHVCRTVCRRAERLIIALDEGSEVDRNLMAYVNRLSDYFFVLSRYLNNIEKVDEKIWQNPCK